VKKKKISGEANDVLKSTNESRAHYCPDSHRTSW